MITMRPRRHVRSPPPAGDDAGLANLVGRGDEEAFEALFARYRDPLNRYCRAVLRHEQDAEDAFQATMIRAYGALRRGGGGGALRPWLFRIAHNECMRVAGARPAHAGLRGDERAPGASPAERAETREELEQLRDDLLALPHQQRAAIVLREMSGLSHAQIGVALGTTEQAARHLVHDGRLSLGEFAAGRTLACADVRRRISDGDGRVLRARSVRSHLRRCDDCAEFRAAIDRRTGQLAALFPALPAAALQRTLSEILAGLGAGGPGAAAAGPGLGSKAAAVVVSAAALVVSGGALLPVSQGGSGAPVAHAAEGATAGSVTDAALRSAGTAAARPTTTSTTAAGPRGAVTAAATTSPGAAAPAAPAAPADPPAATPAGSAATAPPAVAAPRAATASGSSQPAPSTASVSVAVPPAQGGTATVTAAVDVAVPLPEAPVGVAATAGVSAGTEGVAATVDATVTTPVAPVEAEVAVTVGGGTTASVRASVLPSALPEVAVTVPPVTIPLLGGTRP